MALLQTFRDSLVTPRSSRGDYKLAETLLKSIRDYAVAGNPADHERFQALMGELNRQMVTTDDDSGLLMIAGAAQQALRQHERDTNAHWHGRTTELQQIVSTITSALAEFGDRHSQAAERLVTLEHSLEAISALDDLRAVRQKIEECVTALRKEHQHHSETQSLVSRTLAPPSRASGARMAQADPATGLDTRKAAEAVIEEELSKEPEGVYLALFVIHRIQQINSRYGHAVGDEMLTTFLQHIADSVGHRDQVFRWSGPAFLALVRRDELPEAVATEMRRIASYRVDKELEIRDRSVMVPLSASVCLVALTPASHLAGITAELDQFASSHLER